MYTRAHTLTHIIRGQNQEFSKGRGVAIANVLTALSGHRSFTFRGGGDQDLANNRVGVPPPPPPPTHTPPCPPPPPLNIYRPLDYIDLPYIINIAHCSKREKRIPLQLMVLIFFFFFFFQKTSSCKILNAHMHVP